MDLSVKFCGVKFKNPLVLASGILGITASSWRNVVKNGAGGITTKSIWLHEHKGHKPPVMFANEFYMMNAVGLPDAGIEKAREEVTQYLKWKALPLIASIVSGSIADFEKVAEEVAKLSPQIIEVNISCPNVGNEFGKPFACVPCDAASATSTVKKALKKAGVKIPIAVKLSPNVENIVAIAKAVVEAGADALTLINTAGPGMAINIETRKPILTNRVGGISGPFLKPLAVRMIYDVREALPSTPIIGVGGVLTGRDAIEMMMAGATLVGIGTGVYYRGIEVFKKCAAEMEKWCAKNGVKKVGEIINGAHKI